MALRPRPGASLHTYVVSVYSRASTRRDLIDELTVSLRSPILFAVLLWNLDFKRVERKINNFLLLNILATSWSTSDHEQSF